MKPYPERLHSMFKSGARASDVKSLIAETADLIEASKAAECAAKKRSIDPSIPDDEARTAAHDAQEHAFATERLAEGRRRLEDRLKQLTESEQSKAQAAEYQRVAEETAALADEIRTTVPTLFAQLVDLFVRIEANDAAVAQAAKIKPGGAPCLIPAEFAARGCGAAYWPPSHVNPVERLTAIRLPNFDTWGHIWPIDHHRLGMARLAEAQHRERVALKEARSPEAKAKARAEEEARWTRYEVTQQPYRGFMITDIEHRKGLAGVDNTPSYLWMNALHVARAKEAGLTLKPAPLDESADDPSARKSRQYPLSNPVF